VNPQVCPWWLSTFLAHSLRRTIHNPDKIFANLIQRGNTVADIGCGPGYFTIAMAKLVGEEGRVIAADIQPKMLHYVRRRAEKEGLQSRILLHQCQETEIGIKEQVDFALAFYMVHEVPDIETFFKEIAAILKPDAAFLLVEPIVHVTARRFEQIIQAACAAGLKSDTQVKIFGSRAMLFSPI
jgi:ubiquinone/menaquinone biosynthesis C-methylase UbiE